MGKVEIGWRSYLYLPATSIFEWGTAVETAVVAVII